MRSGGMGSGGGGMDVLGFVVSLGGPDAALASLGAVDDALRTGRGFGGMVAGVCTDETREVRAVAKSR